MSYQASSIKEATGYNLLKRSR